MTASPVAPPSDLRAMNVGAPPQGGAPWPYAGAPRYRLAAPIGGIAFEGSGGWNSAP